MSDFISNRLRKAIQEKAKSLSFFVGQEGAVGIQEAEKRMVRWCQNFAGLIPSCRPLERVISSIEFLQDDKVLTHLIEYLKKNHQEEMRSPVFTYFGEASESSSRIMASLKGNANYFESMSEAVAHCRNHPASCIVTIDDLINTGTQFSLIFHSWFCPDPLKPNSERSKLSLEDIDFVKENRLRFLFCFYYGMEEGRECARKKIKENGIDGQIVVIKQYSSQSGIFGSSETKYALGTGHPVCCTDGEFIFKGLPTRAVSRFYDICRNAGEQLLRAHKSKSKWDEERYIKCALGYGNSAKLLITQKNVPTITLTCIWQGGDITIGDIEVQWEPLFSRREKTFAGSESSMVAFYAAGTTNSAGGIALNPDEIISKLLAAESDLEIHWGSVMTEISICLENTIRSIIISCYQENKNPEGIKLLKEIEYAICADSNTIYTLELGDLIRFWKQANIPEMWKKNHNRIAIPAIFKSMPLAELIDASDAQSHWGTSHLPKHTVKRFYYNAVEFVKAAFPDTAEQISADYPSPRESSIPNNLPRLEHDFVGRTEEIAQIMEWLSPDSRFFMVSITGVGGVGKSALALEVAYQCLRNGINRKDGATPFFDAYVWTSAKKESLIENHINALLDDSVKSNLNDIISELIRVLAPDHYKNLPDSKKQYQFVKKLLSENRVLLIVDNMETVNDNQVIAFLKDLPSPSKSIITDRRSVQSTVSVPLMELSDEESASLILDQCRLRRVHLNDEQVKDLTRKTGGIPLAIIWAVGLMSAKGWGPEEVTRGLANAGDSPVLEFLFSESFKSISTNSRKILSVLAIPGVPVLGRMLLDWGRMGKTDCEDAISELLEHALIAEDGSTNGDVAQEGRLQILDRTFRLLPLTRIYVKRSTDADIDILRKDITMSLFRMVSDIEDTPEWPSIDTTDTIERYRGLLSWAMEDAFEREDYRLVTRFMHHVGYSLGIRGYHDIRLHLGKLACDAADKSGMMLDKAFNMIMNIGWVYFMWYNFEECKKVEEEGLQLARQAGDRRLEGIAIRTLALIEKERLNFSKAEESLLEAKNIFEEVGDSRFLAITLGSLASLRREVKDYTSSKRYLEEAIRIVKKLKNTEELLTIFLQKLSRLLIKQHKTEEAEGVNKEAQAILTRLKRQMGVAHCKLNQALIHEDRGELALALAYAEEAAELFLLFGAKEDIMIDLNRIREKSHAAGIRCSVES